MYVLCRAIYPQDPETYIEYHSFFRWVPLPTPDPHSQAPPMNSIMISKDLSDDGEEVMALIECFFHS